jgi:hypothetical protein
LDVLNCTFDDNDGRQAAGAAAIAQSLDDMDLRITGTTGRGNVAPICADFLGFYDNSTEPECFPANVTYSQ